MRTVSILAATALTGLLALMTLVLYASSGQIVVLIALAIGAIGAGLGALVTRGRPWPTVWLAVAAGAVIGFVLGVAAAFSVLAAMFAD